MSSCLALPDLLFFYLPQITRQNRYYYYRLPVISFIELEIRFLIYIKNDVSLLKIIRFKIQQVSGSVIENLVKMTRSSNNAISIVKKSCVFFYCFILDRSGSVCHVVFVLFILFTIYIILLDRLNEIKYYFLIILYSLGMELVQYTKYAIV